MKRVIWLPLGLVVLIVVLVLLFVSRSQYGELETDYDALQAGLASVQASYDSFYWFVYGATIIDGEIWLWEVETDESERAQGWDKVK